MDGRTPATDRYWQEFSAATGVTGDYDVVTFGDSPWLTAQLTDLVLNGPKRATATLARDFPDELPSPGDHCVVTDEAGTPVAVIRIEEVRVGPLISVDEAFAYDEGEGERTRDGWLRDHRAYFERHADAEGFAFSDAIETVFERFALVWPADRADTKPGA